MDTDSPDPRDNHPHFYRCVRSTQLASRRLQSALGLDGTEAANTANTRRLRTQTIQPPDRVFVDGDVVHNEPSQGYLLLGFQDQRYHDQRQRSREQCRAIDAQEQLYDTQGAARLKTLPNKDAGEVTKKDKSKSKSKSTKASGGNKANKAARGPDKEDRDANFIGDSEMEGTGKRKRAASLVSGPTATRRVLAESRARRNQLISSGRASDTDSWATLKGLRSDGAGRPASDEKEEERVKGSGENMGSKGAKGRSMDIRKTGKLDAKCLESEWLSGSQELISEKTSQRGQLKRPDLERVRRA